MALVDHKQLELLRPKRKPRSKAGWRVIGKQRIYARSMWEANFARYLEWLRCRANGEIKKWKHEPKTFWFKGIKRGVCSYLPDFQTVNRDGEVIYYEVKGYMDRKSKTKIKRMLKYFPEVYLKVIDHTWFNAFNGLYGGIIEGWEAG